MLTVVAIERADTASKTTQADFHITLAHDERHLRRRVLTLNGGERALIDLETATVLNPGDRLVLQDERTVAISAPAEALYDVRGRTPRDLIELAWHIGNRHLPAAIGSDRITILRDHVIKEMLEGLGATVTEVEGIFSPARGAYSGHTLGGHHHHGEPHGASPTAHYHSRDPSPQTPQRGAEVEQ